MPDTNGGKSWLYIYFKTLLYGLTEMATIEEGSVFEYCEKLYRELDERDGGYYPFRHDKYVFSKAASNFSITENEVNRIFNEYSKQAADIEMEKIKKLPIAIRKKVILQKASDILKNNQDLPFFKLEGPPKKKNCLLPLMFLVMNARQWLNL